LLELCLTNRLVADTAAGDASVPSKDRIDGMAGKEPSAPRPSEDGNDERACELCRDKTAVLTLRGESAIETLST
jgi:hypothetical protein